MSRTLDVYFGEVKAGELVQDAGGSLAFAYASEYLATNNARAISVSMPLREEPYANRIAQAYFSGLLPDENSRQRLAGLPIQRVKPRSSGRGCKRGHSPYVSFLVFMSS